MELKPASSHHHALKGIFLTSHFTLLLKKAYCLLEPVSYEMARCIIALRSESIHWKMSASSVREWGGSGGENILSLIVLFFFSLLYLFDIRRYFSSNIPPVILLCIFWRVESQRQQNTSYQTNESQKVCPSLPLPFCLFSSSLTLFFLPGCLLLSL